MAKLKQRPNRGCRPGYCAVKDGHYQGGNDWVGKALMHRICPICLCISKSYHPKRQKG